MALHDDHDPLRKLLAALAEAEDELVRAWAQALLAGERASGQAPPPAPRPRPAAITR